MGKITVLINKVWLLYREVFCGCFLLLTVLFFSYIFTRRFVRVSLLLDQIERDSKVKTSKRWASPFDRVQQNEQKLCVSYYRNS